MASFSSSDDVVIVMRCAWCKHCAVDGRWLPETEALGPDGTANVLVTHGICPPCAVMVKDAWRR